MITNPVKIGLDPKIRDEIVGPAQLLFKKSCISVHVADQNPIVHPSLCVDNNKHIIITNISSMTSYVHYIFEMRPYVCSLVQYKMSRRNEIENSKCSLVMLKNLSDLMMDLFIILFLFCRLSVRTEIGGRWKRKVSLVLDEWDWIIYLGQFNVHIFIFTFWMYLWTLASEEQSTIVFVSD